MIETERLLLRKFTLDDIEAYFRLNSNPDVIRYTGDPAFISLDDARRVLLSAPLRDYEVHGYGRLACVEKASGELIGFCGLKYLDDMDEVDLGYRFLPDYWGKGYATESSLAVMRYGRNVMGLERIVGFVHPDNAGSVRVLVKVGMKFERQIRIADVSFDVDLYA